MKTRVVALSPRSNFLQCPTIRAYHSAFFHGVASRNGRFSPSGPVYHPFEDDIPTLDVEINRYSQSNFTWPEDWPIVTENIAQFFLNLPFVHCEPVRITRVINVPWSREKPLGIMPSNLTNYELFHSFEEVDANGIETRYEVQTIQLRKFSGDVLRNRTLEFLSGTEPLADVKTIQVSTELFATLPVFSHGLTMILVQEIFDEFRDLVDPLFFNVREYEID